MKILEIIPQLSSGGAERFTVDLSNQLCVCEKKEVVLVVLHPFEGLDFYKSELSPKIKVISLNKKKGVDILLLFKIYKVIKEEQPDVVHTHLRAIVYSFFAIFCYRKRIKFVHTVHNDAFKEAGRNVSYYSRKFLFSKRWTTPVTISHTSDKSFEQLYGFKATMIVNGRNIPEGLSVSQAVIDEFKEYRKSDDTKVLVNLARINSVKRQTMLAKIASQLTKEGYNFTLLIIGNTKNIELVDEIKSYKCPDIYVLGERNNPLEYLKMADAYCLCSTYEGLPISLIEAMGVGIVPVCTPVGGIIDIVKNGINGFLSSDTTEDAYYTSLRRFLDLKIDEMQVMKAESLNSYLPYSMTQCALKYINLFNQKNIRS